MEKLESSKPEHEQVNVNFNLEQATKTKSRCAGIALLFL